MRSMFVFAAMLALASPAAAQAPQAGAPASQQAIKIAELKPGLVVKDTMGVVIGEVVEVKEEGGREIVMIKMDGIVFAFDGANLAFDETAAYTNATRFALRAGLRAAQAAN